MPILMAWNWIRIQEAKWIEYRKQTLCDGTGTDSTVPTNNGTLTDSSSEYTGFISVICGYIYRTGEL